MLSIAVLICSRTVEKMKLLLALSLFVALSSAFEDTLFSFEQGYKYSYEYNGDVASGIPQTSQQKNSTLRFQARVDLSVPSDKPGYIVMELHQTKFFTCNEEKLPCQSFSENEELTQELWDDLHKPVAFEFTNGKVGRVLAPASTPEAVLNIQRGIVNLFQLNLKSNEEFYTETETSISGICETEYGVISDGKIVKVTKVPNFDQCSQKVQKLESSIRGYLVDQKQSPASRSAVTSSYVLHKLEPNNVLMIDSVTSDGKIFFTPYSEEGGSVITETKQSLKFLQITKIPTVTSGNLIDRGTVLFNFPQTFYVKQETKEEVKTTDFESAFQQPLNEMEQPSFFMNLISLVKKSSADTLRETWAKKLIEKETHRRWFLDSVAASESDESIEFLHQLIEQDPEFVKKYSSSIFSSLAFTSSPSKLYIQKLKSMCDSKVVLGKPKQSCWLAFGSVLGTFCQSHVKCPHTFVATLVDRFTNAQNDTEKILFLKAMGNLGNPAIIPYIRKTLSQVEELESVPSTLSVRSQIETINALRKLAVVQPIMVRGIVLPIFANPMYDTEVRIAAVITLFETKPSAAYVTMIANYQQQEMNNQVASFTRSYMKTLAENSIPSKKEVGKSCKYALKFTRDITNLKYPSAAAHISSWSERHQFGVSADTNVIFTSSGYMPRSARAIFQAQVLGTNLDIVEVGFRAEGLRDVFERIMQTVMGKKFLTENVDSIQQIRNKVFGHSKYAKNEEPWAELYTRLFGNEIEMWTADKECPFPRHLEMSMNMPTEAKLLKGQDMSKWLIIKTLEGFKKSKAYKVGITFTKPNSLGLPIRLNYTMHAISSFNATGNFTQCASRECLNLGGQVSHGYYSTHDSRMEVLAGSYKGGVGISMNMSFNMAQFGFKLDLNNMTKSTPFKNISFEFEPVTKPWNYVNMSVEPFIFQTSEQGDEKFTVLSTTGSTKEEDQNCCPFLKKNYGVDHCLTHSYTNSSGVVNAPFCPLSGPKKFGEFFNFPEGGKPSFKVSITNEAAWTWENWMTERIHTQMNITYQNQTHKNETLIQLKLVPDFDKEGHYKILINNRTKQDYEKEYNTIHYSFHKNLHFMNTSFTWGFNGNCCDYLTYNQSWQLIKPSTIIFNVTAVFPYTGLVESSQEWNFTSPWTLNLTTYDWAPVGLYGAGKEWEIMFRPLRSITKSHYALPFPVYIPQGPHDINTFRRLYATDQTEGCPKSSSCVIAGESYKTFDSVNYNYTLPGQCQHILVEDCVDELSKFVILESQSPYPEKKIITAFFLHREIVLLPDGQVMLDQNLVSLANNTTFEDQDVFNLTKNGENITLQTVFGVQIKYNEGGSNVTVHVSPTYDAKTCGLCGNNNGEQADEFMKPDQKIAKDESSFGMSWVVSGEKCSDECKIAPKFIEKREEWDQIRQEYVKCFSTEPVYQCVDSCSAIKTTSVPVGFHCVKADSILVEEIRTKQQSFKENSVQPIHAPLQCNCASSCEI